MDNNLAFLIAFISFLGVVLLAVIIAVICHCCWDIWKDKYEKKQYIDKQIDDLTDKLFSYYRIKFFAGHFYNIGAYHNVYKYCSKIAKNIKKGRKF